MLSSLAKSQVQVLDRKKEEQEAQCELETVHPNYLGSFVSREPPLAGC